MRLLGHRVVRNPFRNFLSRGFARAASSLMGVSIRDTQCGAKMFRVSPEVWSLFREPFRTKWIFDVELFARLMRLRGKRDAALLQSVVYEFPLEAWREMRGSRIGMRGLARAAYEFSVLLCDYRIRCTWRPGLVPAVPERDNEEANVSEQAKLSGTVVPRWRGILAESRRETTFEDGGTRNAKTTVPDTCVCSRSMKNAR